MAPTLAFLSATRGQRRFCRPSGWPV